MDEREWLAETDPHRMIAFVAARTSDRKLRLFACAACRRIGHLMSARCRTALDLVERFADGLETGAERSRARKTVRCAAQGPGITTLPTAPKWERRAASAVYWAAARDANEAARYSCELAIEALIWQVGGHVACQATVIRHAEQAAQMQLIRDVFGTPFRPIKFAAEWRTKTVVAFAEQMCESRDFGAMPVLADALQDAGCDNDDILNHCRSANQVHARGCWVVDFVMSRE